MAQRVDPRNRVVDEDPLVAEKAGRSFRRFGLGRARQRDDIADIPEGLVPSATVRRDTHYRRALVAADVLAVAASGIVAVTVLGHDVLRPTACLLLPVVVAVSKVVGLYDRDPQLLCKSTLDEAPALFQAATFFALVFWVLDGLVVDGVLGNGQVLGLWLLLFTFMLVGRGAARSAVTRLTRPERCLVIGSAASALRVRDNLEVNVHVNGEVVGRVPLRPERRLGKVPVASGLDALGLTLVEQEIDRVLVAPGTADTEEILGIIRLVRSMGVKVSLVPRLFEAVGSSVDWDAVNGVVLLGVRPHGLTRSSAAIKRVLDIVLATLGIVLLAPLYFWIAVAIKLDSRGPVLFRQMRIGRRGRRFSMLKFRTMVDGADAMKESLHPLNEASAGLFKIENDPRITRVGRFLRESSLDEMPQLLNVLRGEMSLVGPRPLVPEDDRQVEGWERRRLMLTPGMTGLWQVLGSSRVPLQEMVKIDYLYGANWSLWGDVKILIRTVPYAVCRRGM